MSERCTRDLTVIARNATDGFYYPGFITRNTTGNEEYNRVTFLSIKPQDVPVNHVITIGGATPWPDLKVMDYVLVNDRCRFSNIRCYIPGRVLGLPIDLRHENKFFVVQVYTGHTKCKIRRQLIKIGSTKFCEILGYIRSLRHGHISSFVSEPDLRSFRWTPLRRPKKKKKLTYAVKPPAKHPPRKPPPISITSSSTSLTRRRSHDTLSVTSSRKTTSTVQTGISRVSSAYVSRVSDSGRKQHPLLLKPGDDVLARWQDDGWYYFGKVVEQDGNNRVKVLDSTGYEELIQKEDILVSDESEEIRPRDTVIALHPRYVHSYAPATVYDETKNDKDATVNYGYRVIFYDGSECRLPRSELYKISHAKFAGDVRYIKEQELKLCGDVVARDDASGIYRRYMAENTDHTLQKMFLQTTNNLFMKQSAIHIFSCSLLEQSTNRNWEFVLAPVDPVCTTYLPAKITCALPFRLQFCDGTQSNQTKLQQCFYISEHYYKNAANFFNFNYSALTRSNIS